MRVKQGRVVLLDYMVRVGTGRVVETSAGKAPIEYLHGAGQILPALERALDGLKEGEQAAFSIAASDAYGERKDDNVVSLPRSEEHTSELQSRSDLVCRLLLEKKKKKIAASRVLTLEPSCMIRAISMTSAARKKHTASTSTPSYPSSLAMPNSEIVPSATACIP